MRSSAGSWLTVFSSLAIPCRDLFGPLHREGAPSPHDDPVIRRVHRARQCPSAEAHTDELPLPAVIVYRRLPLVSVRWRTQLIVRGRSRMASSC
jgi:hypothetical protein